MHPTARLLRQGSVYTLGTLLQLSAAALVIPLLTRLFEPAQFGIIALALTVQILLSAVVSAGLPTAITRMYFDEEGSGGIETGRQLIVSTMLVAAGATVIVGASAPLWIGPLSSGDPGPLAVGIGLGLPAAVSGSALALLRVQERPAAFLSITMLSSVGAQLAGVGALLASDGGPTVYLVGYGGAVTVAAAIGVYLTGSFSSRPGSRRLLRSSLAIGLPSIPIKLSALILSTGDRFVIQVLEGSAAVGRYQVAYALGTLPMTFLSALNLAWVPITFGLPEDERWPALAQLTTVVVQIAAMLCAVIALGAPFALSLMMPASYAPSELVAVSALVALAALPWALILAAGQILLWHRNMRSFLWIVPLAAALDLGLVVLLLPKFGLDGAAVATVVALTLQAALLYRAATRLAPIRWDHRGMAVALALGVLAVAVALALPATPAADGVGVLAAVGVTVLVVRTIRTQLLPKIASPGSDTLQSR